MTANQILLRRANRLLVPKGNATVSPATAATFNLNLQPLGYTLHPEVLDALQASTWEDMVALFDEVVNTLKELRGVKRYRPMYPNFPKQVMEASAAELYINAAIHYFSAWAADVTGLDCIWLPKYVAEQREPLDEKVELTVIRLGTEEDVKQIGNRIVASNTSISDADKADLKFIYGNGALFLPENIPNKENLATVLAIILGDKLWHAWFVKDHVKTATDVLRLAVAMSSGDVSLAEVTKFRNFSRRERRFLLSLLVTTEANRFEDMQRWRGRWIRLAEKLHPGEFADTAPGLYKDFTDLRSQGQFRGFNSKVEMVVRAGDTVGSVKLLAERPGEFARRLDQILRLAPSKKLGLVYEAFEEVCDRVSTPVLLQAAAHFRNRDRVPIRTIFPKGNTAKVKVLNSELPPIGKETCLEIANICNMALIRRFQELSPLGNVFLDPDLQDYLVPFSQRSASGSLRTLVRGSRIKFGDEKNTIRFFIYWKNGADRTDIDLSAVMFAEDWTMKERIAYYNLRSQGYQACHSGDITSAPKGACEFIDIDIPSVLAHGGRYVVMMVNSFTRQKFSEVPECTAGWMLREKPDKGGVFDARTVVDRLSLTSQSIQAMPMILDLAERKIVWADAAIKANAIYANNVAGNMNSIGLVGYALTQVRKPTLYDLLDLHVAARGRWVYKPEEAEVAFTAATTPYELDRIAAEFMVNAPAKRTVSV